MALVRHETTLAPGRRVRADRVVQELTFLSRSGVFGLFDHRCVTVNGEPCLRPGAPLHGGDVVVVRYDPHTRYRARPRPPADGPFRVAFEDDHLIVVDKRAGVLTVPTDRRETDTLVHAIGRYLGGGGPARRVEVVQRLDRDVSGLLVFAKTREAARGLIEQFAERKPEREYVALVAGELEADAGVFESRLATTRDLLRYSTDEPGEGEPAITRYRVERRLRGATRVRVRLETGRRNQIRVHFAEAGHPVLGDPRYAPDLSRHPDWRPRRLALHAALLAFRHPVTGEPLRFESRPPRAFLAFEAERGRRRKDRHEPGAAAPHRRHPATGDR